MPEALPTQLKAIKGTCRTDRDLLKDRQGINLLEPTPARALPDAPDHLSVRAKRAFRKFANLLFNMGVLTDPDAIGVERLAATYVDTLIWSEIIDREGHMIDGKPHPAVDKLADADRRLLPLLREFGMTPASRAKVAVADKGKQQDLDKYFGIRRCG